MSPKLKKGLIIGGAVLGGLLLVIIVITVIAAAFAPRAAGVASDAYYYEQGYGMGGGPWEEPAMEAPMPAAVEAEYMDRAQSGQPPVTTSGIDVGQAQQIDRLIIRNGNVSVSVADTYAAKQVVEQMVASMAGEGAFIVSSSESGGAAGFPYISMSIRVPATRFDEAMDLLVGLAVEGTTPSVNETAQDVTEEYVDLQARVQSLETARDRLLELMQGAETTEDLLLAEQQLTVRETEIESLKARMRYLSESARLSRIDIALQPYILSQPVDTRWRPAETVRHAIESLLRGGRDFGDFLIYFVIAVLPWLLVFAAFIYVIVRLIIWRVRVGQRRRAARAAPPAEE